LLTEFQIKEHIKPNKVYYIVTYDIASESRLPKMLKICRKYLNWIQMSVFEGHLTEAQYSKLKAELTKAMNKNEDSIICFSVNDMRYLFKEVLGIDKNEITNFV